jgi:hypothetical protein
MGAKFFLGGFEEDVFRPACHNRPLVVSPSRLPQQLFDGS